MGKSFRFQPWITLMGDSTTDIIIQEQRDWLDTGDAVICTLATEILSISGSCCLSIEGSDTPGSGYVSIKDYSLEQRVPDVMDLHRSLAVGSSSYLYRSIRWRVWSISSPWYLSFRINGVLKSKVEVTSSTRCTRAITIPDKISGPSQSAQVLSGGSGAPGSVSDPIVFQPWLSLHGHGNANTPVIYQEPTLWLDSNSCFYTLQLYLSSLSSCGLVLQTSTKVEGYWRDMNPTYSTSGSYKIVIFPIGDTSSGHFKVDDLLRWAIYPNSTDPWHICFQMKAYKGDLV